MNRRSWLILSLVLNLLLVGVVVWACQRRVFPKPIQNPGSITNRLMRASPQPVAPNSEMIEVSTSFHWAQLESVDYRIYMENLRAIGCPEETIRDIVEADINDLFSARITALVNTVTGHFWELMLKQEEFEEMINEKEDELRAMQTERRDLLEALFGGDDFSAVTAQRRQKFENLRSQFEFLSDEKIVSLQEIDDQFQINAAALAGQPLSAEERRKKQAELDSQKEQQLRSIFSDSELAEYKLRAGNSGNLRYQLLDLDITEAEVRELAIAKSKTNGTDQIKALLGSERYVAYQRASDATYQQTLRITDRFDLPSETAVQVYQLRKEAEALANQIRHDQNRPVEERAEILWAMQRETETSIGAVLGPTIFKTYQKHSGDWLSRFSDVTQ